MSVSWLPVGLEHTSENTVVYNLIHDMVSRLEGRYHRHLTVISPTPFWEQRYGFDALIHALPRGRLSVYQFKRPCTAPRKPNGCVHFRIDRDQHASLLNRYRRVARYVFRPIPWTLDFVQQRTTALNWTIFPNVGTIPSWMGKTNLSRTVRLRNPLHPRSCTNARQPCPAITDPRKWLPCPKNALQIGRL
jgi:hypothetical protein